MEEWRTVVIDGEVWDNYEVSNLGRVRSLDRVDCRGHKIKGKILKSGNNGHGYLFICLYNGNKTKQIYIHRLVAMAFIPNLDNLPQINHINENRQDNRVENLEWCDSKYNSNYGSHNAKLSESAKKRELTEERRQVLLKNSMEKCRKVICLETGTIYESVRECIRQTGLDNITHCCKGKYKTAGGYHWMYYDEYLEKENLD